MTRKHFEYAAALVRQTRSAYYPGVEIDVQGSGNVSVSDFVAEQVAAQFVRLFTAYNPRFDEQRFLRACGFDNLTGGTAK